MHNTEFLNEKSPAPLKQQVERIASDIWFDSLKESDLNNFQNPWALYELASKTQFRNTAGIELALNNNDMCGTCQACCIELIQSRQHMPAEIFKSDECCLLAWKQEMRENHDEVTEPGPQLDYTITILKPDSDPNAELAIISALSPGEIIASKEVKLSDSDIAFLYTSAYGKDFIDNLLEYMTSGSVKILLLYRPDIGIDQNKLKKAVRLSLETSDPLRNNIHFPDSIHESLAQSTYFFPEESQIYVKQS